MNYIAASIYVTIMTIIGACVMAADKTRAVKGRRRISENALFLTALLGGGIGCIIAMYAVRHKTRRIKFTIGMPIATVISLAVIYGAAYLFALNA